MCRWMAYSGNSLPLDELLFNTEYSLIDQSMSATMSAKPTNGDGFGIGLALLGCIFYPILGFGSATYSGPPARA